MNNTLEHLQKAVNTYIPYDKIVKTLHYYPTSDNGCEISGNTYGVKEALKSQFNARWDSTRRLWKTNVSLAQVQKTIDSSLPIISPDQVKTFRSMVTDIPPVTGFLSSIHLIGTDNTNSEFGEIYLMEYNPEYKSKYEQLFETIRKIGLKYVVSENYD